MSEIDFIRRRKVFHNWFTNWGIVGHGTHAFQAERSVEFLSSKRVDRKTVLNYMMIDDQVEKYLSYSRKRRTWQTMRSKNYIIKKFAKEKLVTDMQDFTNAHLDTWINRQLKRGVSGRTINTRAAHIIAFCRWLKDNDCNIQLKFKLVEKVEEVPPRRNFFTREQIEIAKRYADPLEWLLISISFDSGLRLSELTHLRLSDIKGREIRTIGKGNKRRQTFITSACREKLDEWIATRNIQNYLWPSPMYKDGRPYSTDEIRHRMRKPFELANISGFYPHAVRHSFGTDLQLNKAPLDVIQRLLGHESLSTTQRYLHGLDNCLAGAYDKFKYQGKGATIFARFRQALGRHLMRV